ncbi:DeoR family transcriptional regulator [Pseudoscardovia radai]|uniref:DeoR family transcriptional regulator n=1 Tax=Pseudoscardovia radai TaxID=987066 RepID=UPI003995E6A3
MSNTTVETLNNLEDVSVESQPQAIVHGMKPLILDGEGRIVVVRTEDELMSDSLEESLSRMSAEEKHAWADTVTDDLRNAILDVEAAKMRFDELAAHLAQEMRLAYSGGAWKLKGYGSWADYWASEFSETKLYSTAEERRDLARYLRRKGGFSTRMIAPVLHVSKETVRKDLAPDSAEQLATKLPVAQDSNSEQLARNGTVDQDSADGAGGKIVASSGILQAQRRTDEDVARDYALMRALQEWGPDPTKQHPMTEREIAEYVGVPQRTVHWTLSEGFRGEQMAVLRCKAWDMARGDDTLTLGEAARRLRLDPLALEWLGSRDHGFLDPSSWPREMRAAVVDTFLEQQSIREWADDHGYALLRVDGEEVTQAELADIIGCTQSAVSQRLKTLVRDMRGEERGQVTPLKHKWSPQDADIVSLGGGFAPWANNPMPEDDAKRAAKEEHDLFLNSSRTGLLTLLGRLDDEDMACADPDDPAKADAWLDVSVQVHSHILLKTGSFFNALTPACLAGAVERGAVTPQQVRDLMLAADSFARAFQRGLAEIHSVAASLPGNKSQEDRF